MRLIALVILTLAGCAGQAEHVDAKDEREAKLEHVPTEGDGSWAYIAIPNDRTVDNVAPLEGVTHDALLMPADDQMRDRSPESNRSVKREKVRVRRCKKDTDCTADSMRQCLWPTGGPHPHGICGSAVDRTGRPTPNRRIRSCSPALRCPENGRCVMAYGGWGVCFR